MAEPASAIPQPEHEADSTGNRLEQLISHHENLLIQLKAENALFKKKNDAQHQDEPIGGAIFDRSRSYDPESEVGRRIDQFLKRTEKITPPAELGHTRDYMAWKEGLWTCAERARVHYILRNKEENCPSKDENEILFWKEQDNWLYYLIWDSLNPGCKTIVKRPKKRSAYVLWKCVESKFCPPLDLAVSDVCNFVESARPGTDFVHDIHHLRGVRKVIAKLDKMDCVTPSPETAFAYLEKGLSPAASNFLQRKINNDPMFFETLDMDQLFNELDLRLTSDSDKISLKGPAGGLPSKKLGKNSKRGKKRRRVEDERDWYGEMAEDDDDSLGLFPDKVSMFPYPHFE